MPLSEHEQRLLDEMERNLYQNDADFAAKVSGRGGRPAYRSVVLGILLALVGIGGLIAGLTLQNIVIGVAGFVAMFAGVLLALAPSRRPRPRGGQAPSAGRPKPAASSGFMDHLNERWDRRQEGRGE